MGQHKSDKDFRNKLDQREITPSVNAWDRLDAMLTVAEEKKPKRSYGWLYIAATIAGFLLIGTIFFSQTEKVIDKGRNEVVNQNKPTPTSENENAETEALLPIAPENQGIAEASEPKLQPKVKSSTKNNQNQQTIINQDNQINQNHHPSASEQAKQSTNPTDAVNEINKNQSLIASNTNQKAGQQTSAKVDELLAAVEAQKSVSAKSSVKVSAKSLLSEVDKDVNLSFREKLMRTAHRNYQEVAEAVSTRNIQQ